jgi:hypothetical protein
MSAGNQRHKGPDKRVPLSTVIYLPPNNPEMEAYRLEAGIPAFADVTRMNIRDPWMVGKQRFGYRIDVIGIPVPFVPDPPPWPYFPGKGCEPHTRGRIVQLWCLRIFYKDAPVFGQLRWHPSFGTPEPRITTEFRGPSYRVEDATRIAEGLLLLEQQEIAGVGGHPDEYTDAEEPLFFNDLQKTVHEAVRKGETVNWTALGRHGLHDKRTYKKYVKHFGYDLQAIAVEAVQCTKGLKGFCSVNVRDRAKFKKSGADNAG